ncbi:MAG TPA: MBOAT family O-acyltransferase [Acidiferrobacterales bacterium]|nr:MBOAT family O-acyltransferase [Acidiferrobacterales bacterium]
MSFATWYFPFFLVAISTVFWLLPRRRLAFIVLASLVFYSFWDVRFCSLLIAAAASDYLCTRGIEEAPPPPATVLAIGMFPTAWLLVIAQFKEVAGFHVAATALACLAFCLLFIAGSRLKEENRRRFLLYLAVGVNLGILVFFKYANWFSAGLLDMLQRIGISADWVLLDVLLPVGISFHTFQSIAYVVDVFDKRCKAERDFWRVLCMIMFFPQLVAGPIERAAALLPQLRFERQFDWRFVVWGLHLLLLGYFLKVFVADNCAVIADYFFKRIHLGESFGVGWSLAATGAYAAQIYGDFVGYSYIARGSAILLGIELTRNFELPLLARSPGEFWRRWHISLSTWIRDYVFLPLSLSISYHNRSSPSSRPAVNDLAIVSSCLIVTMLLAGLWHGADWHFIAFGGFHGVLQVLWLVVPGAKVLSSSAGFLPRIASRMLTFVLVCIAWILFRSDSLNDAARVLASVAGANGTGADVPSGVVSWLAVHAVPLVLLIALVRNEKEEADVVRRSRATLAIAYFLMIILLASSEAGRAQFIYFQF